MNPKSIRCEERKQRSFAAQLPRNLTANIAYFLVNIVIGILLIPYFISSLGVASYGLIPLMTSITGYTAIAVQSLNTAVSRYLTIDLQRGDYEAANKTFNTALFGLSAVIILTIPIVLIVALYVPSIFHVPAGQETNASLLFLGVSAAFLIRSWSGNFTVQLFAFNRLDLQNLINVVNLFFQTGLIIIFFLIFGPNLAYIGAAYVMGAIAASGLSIFLAQKIYPNLQASIQSFDRSRIRDLWSMGGWVAIDYIGGLLLFQSGLVVANLLLGATSAGEYSIALQWGILLQSVAAMLSGVLVPTILGYYIKKTRESLIMITRSAIKFLGLIMALPVGLICGFAPELLTIWVGSEYSYLAPLLVLMTAPLAINMTILPLFSINVAYNKVKIPGLMTIFLGIIVIVLAIAIPLITGWGYYGIALAGLIVLTFRHVIFVPWYAARILNARMAMFVKSIVPGGVGMLFVVGMVEFAIMLVPSLSLLLLLVIGTVATLVYGVIIWKFALTAFEKQFLTSYLPTPLKQLFKDVPQ